jgi:hypothetical protein
MIYKRYFFKEGVGDKIIDDAWALGIKFRLLSVGSKRYKQSYKLRFDSNTQYERFNRLVKFFLRRLK